MDKYKKYSLITICLTLGMLTTVMVYTYIVDPLFHFHKPNPHFNYIINNQRYQNDGILRHFDYDAIITGTSMVSNFKASEFDNIFHTKSVKVPFHGGTYQEIDNNLKRALKYNKNVKYVMRSFDMETFFTDKDYKGGFDLNQISYLIDDNYFNDLKYLLNKSLFFNNVLSKPIKRGTITSFDEAYNWNNDYPFGKEAVLNLYNRQDLVDKPTNVSEKEIQIFQENIDVNFVSLIENYPNVEFYYFFPPYSIIYWDELYRTKNIDNHLLGEKMVIESLTKYNNVHLFSFNDDFFITTNLEYYENALHYSEDINSYILQNMKNNNHEITKDNYKEYLSKIKEFYENYDYDRIFEL